ncbi:MAG: polyribonucleotide nucleotidyltransferase [Candidatus Lloydbacteria bacterium RIFCSPHIGHO2_02_FULL_54_17]|uniref:Polyribonucleotide nucleotidyltransferase n=1 Tax=Candidatus Lloydbacteria bacterium RIFCSPHIGHO2_02_FULL_54_17 TaxID=1798664 RepID=A0A1G2DF61_9BACT|nr:MAG: polyribonucleotide nucleotidyltransferase [Candidatus Lloydbacteria bacterium RIFCSPHIGHO2_01_FULL_54_11]OGZ12284.1 MAG: polyribonucleotide nucleotidyltransferase [Candidatus Lloydbacteria bacterium RIFCSPHIGHO2_02_FULL_54_17]OGZ13988.1 MAG: polyribonucleotide nucleotidyltransferase [Candidatus Lloydbacteria bacterium RIFCSPLOWO2_01_FULL_54_18]OGZ16419.1 MAG: polyribonucleotide nucleotidyltransferase [Candidatus Lloydbacteria bacterium RIFCSPLOWO2_02_FULL_54_12]
MHTESYEVEIGGKKLIAEFTDLADQAHGSVIVRYGNTTVLATAVMSNKKRDGGDFFPLTVDFEERFYAAGQILGSRFMRREGRPSDAAVLSGRVIDRTIRPLFDQRIRYDVQVVITVLSIDKDEPDVLAVNAASIALVTSDIPFGGPVSAIRVARQNGIWVTLPPFRVEEGQDIIEGDCELVVCGRDGNVNMIEMGGKEVPEDVVMEGLTYASKEIEKLQKFQKEIIAKRGKAKRSVLLLEVSDEVKKLFSEKVAPKLEETIFFEAGRAREYALQAEWMKTVSEVEGMDPMQAEHYFDDAVNELLHKKAIEGNKRPDGRNFDEVRPLFAQAGGVSPVLHGTGIFYRGGTHILSALTLGGPQDSQLVEGMEFQGKKRYMHHYNFPPYSSGETGRMGGMNRRAIGHGALAEKALVPVLPDKEVFPYTIRIVSESMASNGSTSMASVCGSTLALMDAGVPIKEPVAGIASGLMMESPTKYKVLTDIQGPEDHHGDMDFKVAGTKNGVTAIQMDVKVDGIPLPILKEAFAKARAARLTILDVMKGAIAAPRSDISPYAPKIVVIKIKPDQIGLVIGGGGKTVNEIREKTGAEIDIEDDGTVFITGKNGAAEKAREIIESMTHEYKAGEMFKGRVVRIVDFGAFVEIGHETDGLVHVSEIAPFRVERVTDYLKEGMEVPVVVKEVDERGRISLSIKRADSNFIKPNERDAKSITERRG